MCPLISGRVRRPVVDNNDNDNDKKEFTMVRRVSRAQLNLQLAKLRQAGQKLDAAQRRLNSAVRQAQAAARRAQQRRSF